MRHAVDPFSGDDSAFTPEDEASDEEGEALPSFPEVEAAVNAAIERLGGAVIPKLNWSAPKVRAAAAAACGACVKRAVLSDVARGARNRTRCG